MPIKRKLYRSGFLHVCQKSADNGILFYTIEDFLVIYTVLSVKSINFHVVICALDIMFNHLHIGAFVESMEVMSKFMNSSTSVYAKIYNRRYGLKGQLFKKPFKSAPKMNESKIRDCLFYIWNNPKEKKAVKFAEDYRWNFLKYMESDHPFSEPVDAASVSDILLKLMRKVKAKHEAGEYLDYEFFDNANNSLSRDERLQLIDYVIAIYNPIRRDAVLEKFGSFQSLVLAVNSVTGNEYELSDDNDNEDYRHYLQMISIVRREGINLDHIRFNRKYFEDNEGLLTRLRGLFKREVCASDYEIVKFLHL